MVHFWCCLPWTFVLWTHAVLQNSHSQVFEWKLEVFGVRLIYLFWNFMHDYPKTENFDLYPPGSLVSTGLDTVVEYYNCLSHICNSESEWSKSKFSDKEILTIFDLVHPKLSSSTLSVPKWPSIVFKILIQLRFWTRISLVLSHSSYSIYWTQPVIAYPVKIISRILSGQPSGVCSSCDFFFHERVSSVSSFLKLSSVCWPIVPNSKLPYEWWRIKSNRY